MQSDLRHEPYVEFARVNEDWPHSSGSVRPKQPRLTKVDRKPRVHQYGLSAHPRQTICLLIGINTSK